MRAGGQLLPRRGMSWSSQHKGVEEDQSDAASHGSSTGPTMSPRRSKVARMEEEALLGFDFEESTIESNAQREYLRNLVGGGQDAH